MLGALAAKRFILSLWALACSVVAWRAIAFPSYTPILAIMMIFSSWQTELEEEIWNLDLHPSANYHSYPYCRVTSQISSQCPAQACTALSICSAEGLAFSCCCCISSSGVCWNPWDAMKTHCSEQSLTSAHKDQLHNDHSTNLGWLKEGYMCLGVGFPSVEAWEKWLSSSAVSRTVFNFY